jgi:hypothetical protein
MKMKLLPWISLHHDLRLMIFRSRGIVAEAHVEKTIAMVQKVEEEADEPFDR